MPHRLLFLHGRRVTVPQANYGCMRQVAWAPYSISCTLPRSTHRWAGLEGLAPLPSGEPSSLGTRGREFSCLVATGHRSRRGSRRHVCGLPTPSVLATASCDRVERALVARRTPSSSKSSKKTTKKKTAKKKTTKKKTAKKKTAKKKTTKKTAKKTAAKKTAAKKTAAKKTAAKKTAKKTAAKKTAAKKTAAKKTAAKLVTPSAVPPREAEEILTRLQFLARVEDDASEESAKLLSRLEQVATARELASMFGMLASEAPHGIHWSVFFIAEGFDDAYLSALLDVLPDLSQRAPTWAETAVIRILNTRGHEDDCTQTFGKLVRQKPAAIRNSMKALLERLLQDESAALSPDQQESIVASLKHAGGA